MPLYVCIFLYLICGVFASLVSVKPRSSPILPIAVPAERRALRRVTAVHRPIWCCRRDSGGLESAGLQSAVDSGSAVAILP